jgi:predicted DNA-binding transcriptional regulator YafY
MPKQTFLSRYSLIIKCLENKPSTFEEIEKYLQRQSELHDKDFTISKRTFQRDVKDIYEQLGFEIAFDKAYKYYKIIDKPEEKQHSQRLLESYEMINAINASQQYSNYVFLESRQPKGLEHFTGLLYAIQNKRITKFEHYKYWDETLTPRTVHPLALKESQGRWYLLAIDTKDNKFKTFGLDRISDLDIAKTKFKEKYHYDFNQIFNNLFGILSSDNETENVQLAFTFEQGQYVKNYPLHHSQKIVTENKKQIIIELSLAITYDFVQEILHFGENVKVLQPQSLINQVVHISKSIVAKYK